MYSRNKQGIWETSLPSSVQIDQVRAILSAGADLMNQLQAVLDELKGVRADLREQQLAHLFHAATPVEERPAWKVPKEPDAGPGEVMWCAGALGYPTPLSYVEGKVTPLNPLNACGMPARLRVWVPDRTEPLYMCESCAEPFQAADYRVEA